MQYEVTTLSAKPIEGMPVVHNWSTRFKLSVEIIYTRKITDDPVDIKYSHLTANKSINSCIYACSISTIMAAFTF